MAIKFTDFSLKNNLLKYILLSLALILILFFQWFAVPVIFIMYIIISAFSKQSDLIIPQKAAS
jgi:CDP-diacylglycerol--serine O-phosphatidyltransferase